VIQLDSSLLWQIANFVFLIFLLNFLLYKPMLRVLDERKKTIEDAQREIIHLNHSIEEKMAAYDEKMRQVKIEAMEKNRGLIREGNEEAQSILTEAHDEVAQLMDDFHKRLAREVEETRRILQERTSILAQEIAHRILGRGIQ